MVSIMYFDLETSTGTYSVRCESVSTRNGFKHVAYVVEDGFITLQAKINYLNRTWERFQFESVLNKIKELLEKRGK